MRDDRDPWADVAAARIPAAGVAALAPLRCRTGVGVSSAEDRAWVTFPAGDGDAIRVLMPVTGVEFFARHGMRWVKFGHRLRTADVPPANGVPLDRAIFPAPVAATAAPGDVGPPVPLTVVRGGPPRPVGALRCLVTALVPWADAAPAADLAAVRAARCGEWALLLGGRLPAVPGERFWGDRVLVPAGFRPEPDLPPDVLRSACDVAENELLLLELAGAAAIRDDAFEPLTRAGVRLANR